MNYKMGSLFDGSGGFPLAATLCGIEPRWASEVEPYPIAVTRERFPNMKHLGDISKINGAELEPVDIITFGSPCQDLSVAGKRAGLKHEVNGDEETTRSGLFMEAVRIIKEMRKATNGKYPRFALWENVPGAFSSNRGEDFRIVCEELIKVVEPTAVMPAVPEKGWAYADSYVGDGWSLAYRVFDAQYWGVPQRRRRIHLVVDFRGECAREVLFEREGVRGYFAQSGKEGQSIAADIERSTGADDRERTAVALAPVSSTLRAGAGAPKHEQDFLDRLVLEPLHERAVEAIPYTLKIRSGCEGGGKGALIQKDKSATLATNNDQYLFQPIPQHIINLNKGDVQSKTVLDPKGIAPSLYAGECRGCGGECYVLERRKDTQQEVKEQYLFENHSQDTRYKGPLDISPMLPAQLGTGGNNTPFVVESAAGFKAGQGAKAKGIGFQEEVAPTLAGTPSGTNQVPGVVYVLQGNMIGRADKNGPQGDGINEDVSFTVNTIDRHAVVYALDQQGGKGGANFAKNVMPTLCSDSHGTPHAVAYPEPICVADHPTPKVDTKGTAFTLNSRDYKSPLCTVYRQGGFADYVEGEVGTLKASDGDLGGGSENLIVQRPKYIVRRLTPTECARLQGFADNWGLIDPKEDLTDEEFKFWHEVRNTHAAINGKTVKEYTKKQMLTWYNKLYTDSAEYKMWGNGIALPPALYCTQGMTEALINENPLTQEEREKRITEIFERIGEDDMVMSDDLVLEGEETDLSAAPEEIKAEIIKNDELLKDREIETEKEETEIMVTEEIDVIETVNEEKVVQFDAVEQLRKLAAERKALSNLRPENERFTDDVRAIEYAVKVLEAVGL